MKSIVIWGGTTTGKSIYARIKTQYDVLFFVDGNPALVGSSIDNIKIQPKEEILDKKPDLVVMGILTGYEEAVNYLLEHGFPEERIITKYVDLNTRARIEALERAAQILEDKHVEGAVAELGVYRGDFAKEINRVFPNRKLYLFDTFEGFPENALQDEEKNGLMLNKVGQLSNTSVDLVLSKMTSPEQCVIKKGIFPQSAEGMMGKQYAFVNIDADLYQPVLDGLEYFWSRMSEWGYIFVHDYFSMSYAGSKKAIEEFAEKQRIGFIPIGDTLSVAFCKRGGRGK